WLDHVDRLVVLGEQARVLADGEPHAVLREHRDLLHEAGVLTADAPPAGRPTGTGPIVASLRGGTVPSRGLTAPLDPEVRARRVVSGVSGAGTTPALRTLLDAGTPATGAVHRPAPARIAAVPQNPEHSFVASTVREEMTASPWAEDPRLAVELLERAGLAHLAGAHPHRLSGGGQRRLATAAALAQCPALLVLDEPTVGLDARRRREVLALLTEAAADGCAVL